MSGRRRGSSVGAAVRRRYWRETDARIVLGAWRASGLGLSEFAREHGLKRKRLARWARRLRSVTAEPEPVRFHPVRLLSLAAGVSAPEPGPDPIEIVLDGGCEVRVPAGFAPEDLRHVLEALAAVRQSC